MRLSEVKERNGYTGFEIAESDRQMLAEIFPPKFPDWIGHHITVDFGVKESHPLPHADSLVVVGYQCDESLEALVVAVDHQTKRPDGVYYHITWSLDRSKGRKPVDSKRVITPSYTRVEPIPLKVIPKFFPSR